MALALNRSLKAIGSFDRKTIEAIDLESDESSESHCTGAG